MNAAMVKITVEQKLFIEVSSRLAELSLLRASKFCFEVAPLAGQAAKSGGDLASLAYRRKGAQLGWRGASRRWIEQLSPSLDATIPRNGTALQSIKQRNHAPLPMDVSRACATFFTRVNWHFCYPKEV